MVDNGNQNHRLQSSAIVNNGLIANGDNGVPNNHWWTTIDVPVAISMDTMVLFCGDTVAFGIIFTISNWSDIVKKNRVINSQMGRRLVCRM